MGVVGIDKRQQAEHTAALTGPFPALITSRWWSENSPLGSKSPRRRREARAASAPVIARLCWNAVRIVLHQLDNLWDSAVSAGDSSFCLAIIGSTTMAADETLVATGEESQLLYWAKRLKCSPKELCFAVQAVGRSPRRLRHYLSAMHTWRTLLIPEVTPATCRLHR